MRRYLSPLSLAGFLLCPTWLCATEDLYGVSNAQLIEKQLIQPAGTVLNHTQRSVRLLSDRGAMNLNRPMLQWVVGLESATDVSAEVVREAKATAIPKDLLFEQPGLLSTATSDLMTSKMVTVVAPGLHVGDEVSVHATVEELSSGLPPEVSVLYDSPWGYEVVQEEISWPAEMAMKWSAPTDAKVDKVGDLMRLTWQSKDFAAVQTLPNSLPVSNDRPRIIVSSYKNWEEIGALLHPIVEAWMKEAETSLSMAQWLADLGEAKDPEQLRRALQDKIQISGGPTLLRGWKSWRPAETVVSSGKALPVEAMLLYTALLRHFGHPAQIAFYNREGLDPGPQPFLDFFDGVAVQLQMNDYASISHRLICLGFQPTGLPVLVVAEKPVWREFPGFDLSHSEASMKHVLEIDSQGAVSGQSQLSLSGYLLSKNAAIFSATPQYLNLGLLPGGLVGGSTQQWELTQTHQGSTVVIPFTWSAKVGMPLEEGMVFPDIGPLRLPDIITSSYGVAHDSSTGLISLPGQWVMDLTIKAPPGYGWVEPTASVGLETRVGSLLVEEHIEGDSFSRKITLKSSQAIVKRERYGEFQQLLQEACGRANCCVELRQK